MNKRERVIAAFQGKEVDHVPVCMWKHVPQELWDDDDKFVACQLNSYKVTDVDFVKLSADKYFGWPAPVLDGIQHADECGASKSTSTFTDHHDGYAEHVTPKNGRVQNSL